MNPRDFWRAGCIGTGTNTVAAKPLSMGIRSAIQLAIERMPRYLSVWTSARAGPSYRYAAVTEVRCRPTAAGARHLCPDALARHQGQLLPWRARHKDRQRGQSHSPDLPQAAHLAG